MSQTLTYAVPEGQDPAAVVARLAQDGYDAATPDLDLNRRQVVVEVEGEVDRERVRAAIADAPYLIDGNDERADRVAFADEVDG